MVYETLIGMNFGGYLVERTIFPLEQINYHIWNTWSCQHIYMIKCIPDALKPSKDIKRTKYFLIWSILVIILIALILRVIKRQKKAKNRCEWRKLLLSLLTRFLKRNIFEKLLRFATFLTLWHIKTETSHQKVHFLRIWYFEVLEIDIIEVFEIVIIGIRYWWVFQSYIAKISIIE